MKNIERTVFKVADFVAWQQGGTLLLSPNFQRRPVWPAQAKSLLVDTVVKGLPMPIIFLRERTDLQRLTPIREVVDGQQRLRTLIGFIEPALLRDYQPDRDAFEVLPAHNESLAGKTFQQLSKKIRTDILDYQFSVHVLPSDVHDREILQIFARMNATGVKLNDQELRNAEFFGAFKQLMYDLALEQLDRWRQWRVYSETEIARMQEVEETSDLVMTLLDGLHGKNQKLINATYRKYDKEFPLAPEVSRRFRETMEAIASTIGDDLRHLQFRRKTLFHSLFTFYYDLLYRLTSELKQAKPRRLPPGLRASITEASDLIKQGELSEELAKLLRGATGHLPSRKARLEFLREQGAKHAADA